ncbi:bifunctional (p)ppGpp synthetase/guanosine-3',5'-bis(diphosphate) 3'-pyrophosphohydrolase [bacterium]|jgi:GTP pyrophosphokinase|nr:bifunctional (p)ppGpp synthetase/guanosine-3',5'-bis(diphosphate) 3'-pyrophosphohydrolase [bacterium]MBT3795206.1 bifunctional (p)ppGpp synthetase/guanosine-3',5'-bis(diphosphate) 3'-pyrophosphohydrolase [bacterium]MBT4634477.1 bifunctional (p)ppGpp synthetase/guanosine-3',5'-bis(diphosphate) 3'-pyrophosphohydrolase [bacterium]
MIRFNDILEKVHPYLTTEDIAEVTKAYAYSAKVHGGQKRYSGEPYLIHPMEVTSILADIRLDKESIITGLLHDTIEDTLATKDDITRIFGEEVCALVDGVTKISKLKISSTFEKQAEDFRKLILATGKDIRVILVKLADRLHNIRTISHLPEERKRIFAKETVDLYAPLADRLGIYWIRTELEDRCFEVLKPNEYDEISRMFNSKKDEWEKYSSEIKSLLQSELDKFNLDASVNTRFKNFYSIYKKMIKKNLDPDKVLDIKAFRIISNDIASCYAALGAVHSTWKPIPGRFKDYIALPKSNGYQSLHTVVIGPFGDKVEVQIRTEEMHEIAEYGVAAHWKYKIDTKERKKLIDLPESVKNIFETQTLSDPREFIDAIKDELITDFVYVFTPKGELKELPIDSCVIDFAYAIHTDLGNKCSGARVNGAIVPFSYKLKSGDAIEIIVNKNREPSKDWLKYVVSSKAKSKIRSSIKSIVSKDSEKIGKEILSKKLAKYGLNIADPTVIEKLKVFSVEKKLKNLENLYINYSLSKVNIVEILNCFNLGVKTNLESKERNYLNPNNAIIVGGANNVMVRMANCCGPIYGDEIIGFITLGKGISIHRISCKQILEVDSTRLVEALWDNTYDLKSTTSLRLYCNDKTGILSEVSNLIAKHESNIIKINAKKISSSKSSIYLEILVKNAKHLYEITRGLDSIPDVYSVERLLAPNSEFNLFEKNSRI